MTGLVADTLFSMKGRTVVITGGASGLGKMIARGFLANGAASICIVDIVSERLQATKAELVNLNAELGQKCSVQVLQADLSSEEGLQHCIAEVRASYEEVDCLVLCAGVRKMQKKVFKLSEPLAKLAEACQSMSYADMEMSFKVNLFAPYYMVAGLVDLLGKAAQRGEGRGNVICFSSVAAQHYGQFGPAYQLSKAAVDHMVRIMAAEFAEFYIRVNAISPGLFPSAMNPTDPKDPDYNNMHFERDMPARRAGNEQEMVATALYLGSGAGAYVDGENIRLDGGRLLVMSGKITQS